MKIADALSHPRFLLRQGNRKMERKSFVMYLDSLEILDVLSDEEAG